MSSTSRSTAGRPDPEAGGAWAGREGRAAAAAFLVAFVTLFTQVVVHRVVSVKLVNNLSFLIISLTMLGFALSGVVLTLARERIRRSTEEVAAVAASLFVLSLLLATVIFGHASPGEQWAQSRAGFLRSFAHLLPLALLYTLPFTFCGIILGALLAAPGLNPARIYGWDLVGSALGCVAVIAAISPLGADNAILLACLLMLVGVAATLTPRGRLARLSLLGAAGLCVAAVAQRDFVFAMRYPEGSWLYLAAQPGSGLTLEYVAWDPVARIELSRIPPPVPDALPWPFLVGRDPDFLQRFERVLTQNNTAFTYALRYDGDPQSLRGIEDTLYAAAYVARGTPPRRVLVIGVGGGFDVLTALRYQSGQVVGVEVNSATLDIVRHRFRDYFRPWAEDPRVVLVRGEGRHFVATRPDDYDVVQLSGVDSASGMPGAAHVFSENYLYTQEAFDLYLSRLSPHGIMNMMRAEWLPPREMLRALVTAVGALRRAGVERPADHLVVIGARNRLFSAVLMKRSPFLREEVVRLEQWTSTSPDIALVAAPYWRNVATNAYQAFLDQQDPVREAGFVRAYPFDIRPVTDDRPFFFRYSFWWHLLSDDPVVTRFAVPVLEEALLLLLGTAALAALFSVGLPLWILAARGLKAPAALRQGVFFFAIGLGYLAIEVALLQRFGLFLGHPNLAFSVVLAGLLLGTGIGASWSERIVQRLGGLRRAALVVCGLCLFLHVAVLPYLNRWVSLPFAVRLALTGLCVIPLGAFMGVFMPTGLGRLKPGAGTFVPWAWGLNGMASVISPILGVAVSVTWGVSTLLLFAVPVYLLAGYVWPGESLGSAAP